MASSAFKAALKNTKTSKSVETVLVGTSFLDEGTHEVVIQAVDTREIDNNKIKITYLGEGGKAFTDNMFLLDQAEQDYGFGLRQFWSATIPDTDALAKFLDAVAQDDKAFAMFTGMKLRLILKPGKGVQARTNGMGKFAGYDIESNEVVTQEYEQIADVYLEVKARALKRSYLRITKFECIDKEGNLAAFALAMENRKTDTGVISQGFVAGGDVTL